MAFVSPRLRRIARLGAFAVTAVDLVRTLRPGSPRAKVFAGPAHAGGPATKFAQLQPACAKRGETYGTLICLSSVRVPLPLLALLKRRGAKVRVNQNGVYYPLWMPEGFERQNAFLRRLNELADHTFFQSRFALASFERWVGPPPASHSVLWNAVERARFRPELSRRTDPARLRVLLFLDFRSLNHGVWGSMLALAAATKGVRWVVLGARGDTALEAAVREAFSAADVDWHLSPNAAEVAEVLPSCDVALHFHFNDVCPNKVLECLAAGVPVICGSAGGTRELVEGGGGEVLPVEEGYARESFPSTAEILDALERFRRDPDAKRAAAYRTSERFALEPWLATMTAP